MFVCEIQSKVISNFFRMPHPHSIRSKKRDHSIPEICLLFRSSDRSISRRDISTFKSFLVHLFYIYSHSRYIHFYICVCVKIHLPYFVPLWSNYSIGFRVNTVSFRLGIPLIQSWTYLKDTNRCKTPDSSNEKFYQRWEILQSIELSTNRENNTKKKFFQHVHVQRSRWLQIGRSRVLLFYASDEYISLKIPI